MAAATSLNAEMNFPQFGLSSPSIPRRRAVWGRAGKLLISQVPPCKLLISILFLSLGKIGEVKREKGDNMRKVEQKEDVRVVLYKGGVEGNVPPPNFPPVAQTMQRVDDAAAQFESRWTMSALKRVDPELREAIDEQRQLYHEAQLRGDAAELEYQGSAMCRGWVAATKRMEEAGEPDDCYQIGIDARTGTKVAIGMHRSSANRVMELQEGNVVFLTPDEIAAMFAGLQSVAAVKALWPGSEIIGARPRAIDLYPDEPCKEDAS